MILLRKKQYREDDKDCQKLYSNPDMFFDLWKEDFINKMEEERKKRKEAMKARKLAKQQMKEQNKRTEKKIEKIIPRWVSKCWIEKQNQSSKAFIICQSSYIYESFL